MLQCMDSRVCGAVRNWIERWGRLIFIFLGVEIITITCGIRSRGGKMQDETVVDCNLK